MPPRRSWFTARRRVSGKVVDCCYAVAFHPPHTYTGEPMAELQCHGSTAVLQQGLDALFRQGVRQAEAGEFTRRAFLNGKLGLSEAEAVHDLITARTAEAAQNAAAQVMGAIGSPVHEMREELIGMVAHFHAVVDFPTRISILCCLTTQPRCCTARPAACTPWPRAMSAAASCAKAPCVILGRPNAGKSTLLNALLGRERATVIDIPGTTRDLIEENVKVGQLLLRVTDTAGLRDTTDPIEQAGIDRAMPKCRPLRSSLLCLTALSRLATRTCWCSPARRGTARSPCSIRSICRSSWMKSCSKSTSWCIIVPLSAKTGEGMDKPLSLIPRTVGLGDGAFDGALITNARQAAALARAAERSARPRCMRRSPA